MQGNNYNDSVTNNYRNGFDSSDVFNRSSPGIFQGVNLKANLNQTQPTITCNATGQSPTLNLSEIKEENDKRLKDISKNGWSSHFKMGNDREHLAR